MTEKTAQNKPAAASVDPEITPALARQINTTYCKYTPAKTVEAVAGLRWLLACSQETPASANTRCCRKAELPQGLTLTLPSNLSADKPVKFPKL